MIHCWEIGLFHWYKTLLISSNHSRMKPEMSEESELDTSFSTGSSTSPLASPIESSKCLTVTVDVHPGRQLKFSIENILRPDFGCKVSPGSKCSNGSTPPSTPLSSPAATATPGPNNNLLWPAWVYCTRYSDRPSSGNYLTHNATFNAQ